MYFRKISNKITVSRAVFNEKKIVTIRLYKTSASPIAEYDGVATYTVSTERTASTNGWNDTPYSDSADMMYFVEAEFEVDLNASSVTIPKEAFSMPARFLDRYISITLDKQIARNDGYNNTAMQEIIVIVDTAFYNSRPTIKAQGVYGDRFIDYTVDGNKVYIPYKDAPPAVLVTAWIGSACVASHRFQVTDKTGTTKFAGKANSVAELDSLLADTENGEINVAVYVGEEVSSSKYGGTLKCGYAVYSTGNGWKIVDTIDSVTSGIALSIVKEVAADTPIVGGPISWFNQIVADSIIANKGIFKTLEVGDFSDSVAGILNSVDDKLDSSDLDGYAKTTSVPTYASINDWLRDDNSSALKAVSARVGTMEAYKIEFPADGYIKSKNENVVINGDGTAVLKDAVVTGTVYATDGSFSGSLSGASGTFTGNFDCGVIKTERVPNTNGSSNTVSGSWMAETVCNWIHDTIKIGYEVIIPCSSNLLGPTVKYLSCHSKSLTDEVRFYNSSYVEVDISSVTTVGGKGSTGKKGLWQQVGNNASDRYTTNALDITVYVSSDRLWVSLPPASDTSLTSGMLYVDTNGFVKVK